MKLCILGGGESGAGAAILGKTKGWEVFLSEKGNIAPKYKEELNQNHIRWEEGKHTEAEILQADCIIKSPGIPDKAPIVQAAKNQGIKILSEIEFAYRYTQGKIIAITGSNGKTTTTNLTYHIFKNAGLNVGMVGNVGHSFARMVAQGDKEYYILEVSSFQLDDIEVFCPDIAILLNITPDHLDRYDYDFQKYVDAKFRITENQSPYDVLIYDADDPVIAQELKKRNIKAQLLPFSLEKETQNGAYYKNQTINIITQNILFSMNTNEIALQGKHNVKNTMASALAARIMQIRKASIRQSLEDFKGVAHRLETVGEVNNVRYINDSKATNVNSVYFALDSMPENVIWIVGGQDKGNDYTPLLGLVKEKVKHIICLGIDNQKIINTFSPLVPEITQTQSMEQAIFAAQKVASKGDTVLLSPACASFDLFQSYEDRGDQFKRCVRNLN